MKNRERIILVTNDDGVTAPGIKALIEVARTYGKVVVVAPDSPQSGMGHAITIDQPLRLDPVNLFDELGVEAYQCSGTPVDCVKLAHDKVIGHPADLCLSGINHGSNASINVMYSGTMSAAMEASLEGVPSVGFSLLDYKFDADFAVSQRVVAEVVDNVLEGMLPDHFLLNVNIPKVDAGGYKGLKVCRQAAGKWGENYDHRVDPRGRDYYWMVGTFFRNDKGQDTDLEALINGYASVVPVRCDLTDETVAHWLKKSWQHALS